MTVTNFSFDVVKEAFDNKRKFFDDGKTMTYKFRLDALKKLRSQLIKVQSNKFPF
jgi:hypothetical protein